MCGSNKHIMDYNDTTTKLGLVQDCEFLCQFNDGDISGNATMLATFTRLMNKHYHKTVLAILEAQDTWDFDDKNFSDYPIATTPLVAGQRDYTFPVSLKILKIKRVDVTYDGTNWYRANPIDSGLPVDGLGNSTFEDSLVSISSPRYDAKSNAIWVYPLADASQVSAGAKIRIEFFREIEEFTASDTTKEPGIDRPFHQMISLGASMEYAVAKMLGNAGNLADLYRDMEQRLKEYYSRKEVDKILNLNSTIQYGEYK